MDSSVCFNMLLWWHDDHPKTEPLKKNTVPGPKSATFHLRHQSPWDLETCPWSPQLVAAQLELWEGSDSFNSLQDQIHSGSCFDKTDLYPFASSSAKPTVTRPTKKKCSADSYHSYPTFSWQFSKNPWNRTNESAALSACHLPSPSRCWGPQMLGFTFLFQYHHVPPHFDMFSPSANRHRI